MNESKHKPPRRKPGWGKGKRRVFNGEMLDIAGTASFLGETANTVRSQIARGVLPYRRLGGRLVCLRGELQQWAQGLPGLSLEEAKANLARRGE